MKDDLPAEWLPMRRHVILSRGGRRLMALLMRSLGMCCSTHTLPFRILASISLLGASCLQCWYVRAL